MSDGAAFVQPETEEEQLEAARLRRIAERAELDAEARRRARGVATAAAAREEDAAPVVAKAKFLSRREREAQALARLEQRRKEVAAPRPHARESRGRAPRDAARERDAVVRRDATTDVSAEELKLIKEQYLGRKEKRRHILKPSEKFSRIFAFDWDEKEDNSERNNRLYATKLPVAPLFGRGYVAGIDKRSQRTASNFADALVSRRRAEGVELDRNAAITEEERMEQSMGATTAREGVKHWSEKALEAMTTRDWRIMREDHDIRIQGRAPPPLRSWREATKLPQELHEAIRDLGWHEPTPIQRQAIPAGLMFRDIMGIAETGSGKTAAFALPMLTYILSCPLSKRATTADNGPLAIVMAPTRELALQIHETFVELASHTDLKSVCIVGGQSVEAQGFELRRGVEFVVGTPGRIADCLGSRLLVLGQCNYIVLDEADRMIDMGFEPQVQGVLDAMGGQLKSENVEEAQMQERLAEEGKADYRVTCFFSATMPVAVKRLSQSFLRHPITVQIGDEDTGKNKRIEQRIEWMAEGAKMRRITQLLQALRPGEKVIVFVNIRRNCDMVARALERAGLRNGVLHGGKSQDQREYALDCFKRDEVRILVATDVAGRGLDIPDVTHVFNHDMPQKIENYTHRIGRTGRAGKTGVATSFLTEHDEEVMYDLKEYLTSTGSTVPRELAKNPKAQQPWGTRDESGRVQGAKGEKRKAEHAFGR